MADFQLAYSTDIAAWIPPGGGDTTEIDACLAAATRNIVAITGRTYERKSITETLSGALADGPGGEILRLSAAHAPLDTAVAVTVTENGVALTVSTSYSASAQVIVHPGERNGSVPGKPRLFRQNGPWAAGLNNIVVVWTGGFAQGAIPVELKRCCGFLGADMSKSPTRASKSSRSSSTASTSFDPNWPKWVEECLEYWTLR